MKENIKNAVITILFISFLTSVFLVNILKKDDILSYSERRELKQLPAFKLESLLDREWIDEFEKYSLDQFVFRDKFRTIKAVTLFNIFNQLDNNGVYVIGDSVCKIEYPLKKKSIEKAAIKFNEIYDRYLADMKVYYSIIPDKNYFAAEQNGYPSLDYDSLINIMTSNVKNMEYINIFDSLSLGDYYYTDLHWRQEELGPVVNAISNKMNFIKDVSNVQYTAFERYPFYGAYYGQSALPLAPDKLIYLSNGTIEQAVVYNYETEIYEKVYALDKFKGIDSYDVFLSGAAALITVENKNSQTGKELIMFRDSFGSSLAPLLLEEYSKITLVDLRYIPTDKLGEYIEFKDQDVLLIYNTMVLNNSEMLK